jgi:hypothetical protein
MSQQFVRWKSRCFIRQTKRCEKDNRQISQSLCSHTYNIFTELSNVSRGTQNYIRSWHNITIKNSVWPAGMFIWSFPVAQSSKRLCRHVTRRFRLSCLGYYNGGELHSHTAECFFLSNRDSLKRKMIFQPESSSVVQTTLFTKPIIFRTNAAHFKIVLKTIQ